MAAMRSRDALPQAAGARTHNGQSVLLLLLLLLLGADPRTTVRGLSPLHEHNCEVAWNSSTRERDETGEGEGEGEEDGAGAGAGDGAGEEEEEANKEEDTNESAHGPAD